METRFQRKSFQKCLFAEKGPGLTLTQPKNKLFLRSPNAATCRPLDVQIGLLGGKWPQEQFSQAKGTGIDLLGNLQKSGLYGILLKIQILPIFDVPGSGKIENFGFSQKAVLCVSRATFAENFGLVRFRADRSRKSGQSAGFWASPQKGTHKDKGKVGFLGAFG